MLPSNSGGWQDSTDCDVALSLCAFAAFAAVGAVPIVLGAVVGGSACLCCWNDHAAGVAAAAMHAQECTMFGSSKIWQA